LRFITSVTIIGCALNGLFRSDYGVLFSGVFSGFEVIGKYQQAQ
jgi:hypothetical protein